ARWTAILQPASARWPSRTSRPHSLPHPGGADAAEEPAGAWRTDWTLLAAPARSASASRLRQSRCAPCRRSRERRRAAGPPRRAPRDSHPPRARFADELTNQPNSAMLATGYHGGGWHATRVEVGYPSWRVLARRGYVASAS